MHQIKKQSGRVDWHWRYYCLAAQLARFVMFSVQYRPFVSEVQLWQGKSDRAVAVVTAACSGPAACPWCGYQPTSARNNVWSGASGAPQPGTPSRCTRPASPHKLYKGIQAL